MSRKREELLKKVKAIKPSDYNLSFKDRIFGNFNTKLSILKNELIDKMQTNNKKIDNNQEHTKELIGNVDTYMDKLEQATIVLFSNIESIPSLCVNQLRYDARTFVDSEIKPIGPLLKNSLLNLSLSVYYSTAIEELNNIKTGNEIIELLKRLNEIESKYFVVLVKQDIGLQSLFQTKTVFKFNKSFNDNYSYSTDMLSEVNDFIRGGMGIAGTIETHKVAVKELEKSIAEIGNSKKKKENKKEII